MFTKQDKWTKKNTKQFFNMNLNVLSASPNTSFEELNCIQAALRPMRKEIICYNKNVD